VSIAFGAWTPGFAITTDLTDRKVAVTAAHRANAPRAPPLFA
jgi:hypothetical protein